MGAPKSVRRASRDGGNIGIDVEKSSPGGYSRPEAEPAKVSEPDAEGLQGTLDSLVKAHGISKILSVLGEIT